MKIHGLKYYFVFGNGRQLIFSSEEEKQNSKECGEYQMKWGCLPGERKTQWRHDRYLQMYEVVDLIQDLYSNSSRQNVGHVKI